MFKRLTCVILLACCTSGAFAQSVMPAPAAPIIGAKSYLVIDASTGHELAAHARAVDVVLVPTETLQLLALLYMPFAEVAVAIAGIGQHRNP